MIKRTIIIELTFACCKDEKYRNIDHTISVTLHQNAKIFNTTLDQWKDEFLTKEKIIDYIYSLGDSKCMAVDPSLRMCREFPHKPKIDVIDYYEEIIIEVEEEPLPADVRANIVIMLERIVEFDTYLRRFGLTKEHKEIKELIKEYGLEKTLK